MCEGGTWTTDTGSSCSVHAEGGDGRKGRLKEMMDWGAGAMRLSKRDAGRGAKNQ